MERSCRSALIQGSLAAPCVRERCLGLRSRGSARHPSHRRPGESRGLARTSVSDRETPTFHIWRLWKPSTSAPFGPAMAKLSTSARTIEKDDGTKVELITALGKHPSVTPAKAGA